MESLYTTSLKIMKNITLIFKFTIASTQLACLDRWYSELKFVR